MATLCGHCNAAIAPDDINVATDVAFCRACNKTMALSTLVHGEPAPDVNLANPPRGVTYRDDGNELTISASTRSPIAFFLVPFMMLWSGGSIGGIYGTQIYDGKFDLAQSLFGIPFLIGTVVLGAFVLMSTVGRVEVRLRAAEGRIFTGVGGIGWTRRFDAAAVKQLREGPAGWHKNGRPQMALILTTHDKELTFASTLSAPRRRFILGALRKTLLP